jgi:ribosome-associated protein
MTPEPVAAYLAESGAWHYSRASGPGGQRRDHAATRAELTIRPGHLQGLPDAVADRLRERWALEERPLRLTRQAQRSRERNRQVVIERLEDRVAAALAPPPPRRQPTRPGRGARERRLADKARRAQVKAGRRPPEADA